MDDSFGAIPISNTALLCIGGITRSEAERMREHGIDVDGTGYYLFLASQEEPSKPVEVLAKFWSPSAAEKLAKLMRVE